MNKTAAKILILFLGILLGLGISWLSVFFSNSAKDLGGPEGHKGLTNPLLKYTKFKEYKSFKHIVQNLIDKQKRENMVSYVAVYFRSLPEGLWFGINEREKFTPASLLKVPLMMVCFEKAENDPGFLEKKLRYEGDNSTLSQNIKPLQVIENGKAYTIDELVFRMIVYSDNRAANLLSRFIGREQYYKAMEDLGIYIPDVDLSKDYMTLKLYITLFRVLFNASYLNEKMSEKALSYLARVEFKAGLVAGVPSNLTLAHKFGEAEFADGTKQLHDCGIVYYNDHPYLIGIMTKGDDFLKLTEAIKEISALIYSEVVKQD